MPARSARSRPGPWLGRGRRFGLETTGAPHLQKLVLGDMGSRTWNLEDLAPLHRHDLGVGAVSRARRATLHPVGDHLVGVGDLDQMMAFVPWLLAGSALGLAPLGSVD